MEKEQIIEKDLDAIYIGNLNTVDENLKLLWKGNMDRPLPGIQGKAVLLKKMEPYTVLCMEWATVR